MIHLIASQNVNNHEQPLMEKNDTYCKLGQLSLL